MGKTLKVIIGVVIIAAVIYFAPEIAPFLTHLGLGISLATASAIATAVVSTAISIGAGLILNGLGIGASGIPRASQTGTPQVFRQSITDAFIVYGKRRVGGLLVFFHSRVSGSDHFRYFVIAVAGHRCQGVVQWMLNDEVVTVDGSGKVTTGKYANAAWLWFQRGLASETANATFVSECGGNWTTNHQGNGVAAIYAKFQMTDAAVQAGMPNITAVIEGRDEIRDSRTGTSGYTRNAALIFYDWMVMPREEGGFGAYTDEVPDDTWISAQANVCDETVDGQPRYAFDAYLTTGAAPGDVRDAMIMNMAGSYSYSGGKHLMRPGYWNPVSITLAEADLAGPIQISPFMTSDASATQVLGTYISPADGYQGMPFTTWTRPGASDLRQSNLDLAFTTNLDQANRVAAIMGKRAACEKTVVWPMNIVGVKTRALDTVQVDKSDYGLSNYAWVVTNFGLSFDPTQGPGVVLSLREENSDIYGDPTPVSPTTPPTIVQPSAPLPTNTATILRNSYPKGINADAIDAGSDVTVRIYGPTGPTSSFILDYASSPAQEVTVTAVSMTGVAYGLTGAYLYCDVDEVGDATPHYGLTTNYADAINSSANPLRIYLNVVIDTPASGGTTLTGGGTSSGYGSAPSSTGARLPS